MRGKNKSGKKCGKKYVALKILMYMTIFVGLFCTATAESKAMSLHENPYVEFSPDGQAFTTNPGDRNYRWYSPGMKVETGERSTLAPLQPGQHYYRSYRTGKLPVAYWKVAYGTPACCHSSANPPGTYYHGLSFGTRACLSPYYSGWFGYCADCDSALGASFIYMSREAAATLGELDTAYEYYYLCPTCTNLEQGVPVTGHFCRAISNNQYRVVYDKNTTDTVTGYMESSCHIYGNAAQYEGQNVGAAVQLNRNTYVREGYEFQGWNTMPDGSGQGYADGAAVLNLTTEDYHLSAEGTVTLYAQWKEEQVEWPVVTKLLQLDSDAENVCRADEERTYYVRSDGTSYLTVFLTAVVEGEASDDYQINRIMYHMETQEGHVGTVEATLPKKTIQPGSILLDRADMNIVSSGQVPLQGDAVQRVRRSEGCGRVDVQSHFVPGAEYSGSRIYIAPGAAVEYTKGTVFSDPQRDAANGLWLICDGEGPVIVGAEQIAHITDLPVADGRRSLVFEAADQGCGVKNFGVTITNRDNGARAEFMAEGGLLELEIEEDNMLFVGDYVAEFVAADLVGNVSTQIVSGESLGITAYAERLLSPHLPVFRCGESGALFLTAYGYVEQVQVIFPGVLADRMAELNTTYRYETPESCVREQQLFMIPFGTALGEYDIVVRAIKGERVKTVVVTIRTLGPEVSVLDDVRTRLR